MNFTFKSYFLKINEFEQQKFEKQLEFCELSIPEELKEIIDNMNLDYQKPSYIKKTKSKLILKYHVCGEIIDYDNPRSAKANPNTKYVDGLHPIYKTDDMKSEIYFTEYVEMREPFLDDMTFEMHVVVDR